MKKRNLFDLLNTLFMLFIIFIMLYPFYHVVMASFSDPARISYYTGILLWPLKPYTTEAYRVVFANPLILSGYRNTLFVLIVGTGLNLIMTMLGAYFLTLKGPLFKNAITFMIIFTMYFSGGLVPAYLNVRDLGLYNSLWALIVPGVIGTTNLIILRTAFAGVPESLVDSAMLDGASHPQILFRIIAPLSKATLAVMVIYYGVGHWNSWFGASIYLQNSKLFPLQLVVRNFLQEAGSQSDMASYAEMIKYAMIVVSTAPVLVIYPFFQKYFTKGVMVGAIKG